MSSTYQVLCLSHDPASTCSEHRTAEDALNAIRGGYEGHPHCDLLISRVSGAPVEFGCPPSVDLRAGQHACWGHRDVEWVDADWLRVLTHVREDSDEAVRSLLNRPMLRCWSQERLLRLRYELGIEASR